MKLSAIKVNSALAEQGSWVDSIPDLLGIRIKARRQQFGLPRVRSEADP
jgi:hypothetical protein